MAKYNDYEKFRRSIKEEIGGQYVGNHLCLTSQGTDKSKVFKKLLLSLELDWKTYEAAACCQEDFPELEEDIEGNITGVYTDHFIDLKELYEILNREP